jgi:hypothetical protein
MKLRLSVEETETKIKFRRYLMQYTSYAINHSKEVRVVEYLKSLEKKDDI